MAPSGSEFPTRFRELKDEADRLAEKEAYADARHRLEEALEVLEDFYESERESVEEMLTEVKKELFERFLSEGEELKAGGDAATAKERFEAALDAAPDPAAEDRARELLGGEEEGGGGALTRLEELEEYVAENPDSPEAIYALGVELALDGYLDAAAEQFRRMAEVAGDDRETRALASFRLANVLTDLGDYEGALGGLDEALRLGHDPSEIHFRRGQVAEHQGDRETAVAAFQACLEADPAHAGALSALAQGAAADGKDDEALDWLTKLSATDPEDSETCYRIGEIQERLGRIPEALKAYAKAREVDPEGMFASMAGERTEAIETRDREG